MRSRLGASRRGAHGILRGTHGNPTVTAQVHLCSVLQMGPCYCGVLCTWSMGLFYTGEASLLGTIEILTWQTKQLPFLQQSSDLPCVHCCGVAGDVLSSGVLSAGANIKEHVISCGVSPVSRPRLCRGRWCWRGLCRRLPEAGRQRWGAGGGWAEAISISPARSDSMFPLFGVSEWRRCFCALSGASVWTCCWVVSGWSHLLVINHPLTSWLRRAQKSLRKALTFPGTPNFSSASSALQTINIQNKTLFWKAMITGETFAFFLLFYCKRVWGKKQPKHSSVILLFF